MAFRCHFNSCDHLGLQSSSFITSVTPPQTYRLNHHPSFFIYLKLPDDTTDHQYLQGWAPQWMWPNSRLLPWTPGFISISEVLLGSWFMILKKYLSTQPKHTQILSPRFSPIYDLERSVDLRWLFDHRRYIKWSCYYFLNFNNRWKVHFLCSIWTSTLRPSGWCSTKRTNKTFQVFAVWGLWYIWRLWSLPKVREWFESDPKIVKCIPQISCSCGRMSESISTLLQITISPTRVLLVNNCSCPICPPQHLSPILPLVS